jgi:hypothetical protein
LRHLLQAQLSKHASREYIQVLRLMDTFAPGAVTNAVEDALPHGAISFDAVPIFCSVVLSIGRHGLTWPTRRKTQFSAAINRCQKRLSSSCCWTFRRSSGIALIIQMLIEASNSGQKASTFGLSQHFTKVFTMAGITNYS